ncbi:hypothetical protein [Haloarcula nitratireducens]|uniref:Uncharacterized protein n=1 Tax=Haloarcula nitratireducens TaxID=2487749 RepID=A0AAW4PAQ0_9EURY|nr:hypothetical protein [Halomicroarcula nitratireducens]MBX0294976.1 hypothetical protein [Halomicroarcula nitratireducens]
MEGTEATGETDRLSLAELFTREFMQEYTDFESIEEFWSHSPWEIRSRADVEQIPDNPLDGYVDKHTEFSDAEEMDWVAGTAWAAKRFDD